MPAIPSTATLPPEEMLLMPVVQANVDLAHTRNTTECHEDASMPEPVRDKTLDLRATPRCLKRKLDDLEYDENSAIGGAYHIVNAHFTTIHGLLLRR